MTINPLEPGRELETATIAELLEQRAAVEAWLARLDEQADAASPRVVERVRADYQQRLRHTLEALGQHRGTLREQRASLAEALAEADFRAEQASDELEEARLRHDIGELSDPDWEERRPALEDALSHARERRAGVGDELARLDAILAEVEAGLGATEPAPAAPPADAVAEDEAAAIPIAALEAEPVEEETSPDDLVDSVFADDAPTLASPEVADATEEMVVEPVPAGGDLAFLEQLDRAISDEQPRPRAKPGVKCPECGYTNDPDAWYCGVCGVDLA